MIDVDLTKIKPYGDRLDDGVIQISFTLPIKVSPEAREAAKIYIEKLGLIDVNVVFMEKMSDQFTFFIVYGKGKHTIDYKKVKVPKIETPYMDFKSLTKFMEKNIKEPIVVIGACTGSDAHTVGIDAIFNMKGFDMDYGLERYPLFEAINLRAQVNNKHLVQKAEELNADAILVSQVVTQRDSHIKNLKELNDLIKKSKLNRDIIKIIGGPKIDHRIAKKLGFDAGFGPGTIPSEVASFIVQEYLRRKSKSKRSVKQKVKRVRASRPTRKYRSK